MSPSKLITFEMYICPWRTFCATEYMKRENVEQSPVNRARKFPDLETKTATVNFSYKRHSIRADTANQLTQLWHISCTIHHDVGFTPGSLLAVTREIKCLFIEKVTTSHAMKNSATICAWKRARLAGRCRVKGSTQLPRTHIVNSAFCRRGAARS